MIIHDIPILIVENMPKDKLHVGYFRGSEVIWEEYQSKGKIILTYEIIGSIINMDKKDNIQNKDSK